MADRKGQSLARQAWPKLYRRSTNNAWRCSVVGEHTPRVEHPGSLLLRKQRCFSGGTQVAYWSG